MFVEIYKLAFGTELFDFVVATDASLASMVVLCGEVPPEWRSYWDSRDQLRDMCKCALLLGLCH